MDFGTDCVKEKYISNMVNCFIILRRDMMRTGAEIFGEYLSGDEKLIYWAEGHGYLGVTDKRVIHIDPNKGFFNDIDLDHVTNVSFTSTSNSFYIILAILSSLLGILGREAILGLILAIIFVVAYLYSKKRVVSISTEKDTFTYTFAGRDAIEIGLNFVKYIRNGIRTK